MRSIRRAHWARSWRIGRKTLRKPSHTSIFRSAATPGTRSAQGCCISAASGIASSPSASPPGGFGTAMGSCQEIVEGLPGLQPLSELSREGGKLPIRELHHPLFQRVDPLADDPPVAAKHPFVLRSEEDSEDLTDPFDQRFHKSRSRGERRETGNERGGYGLRRKKGRRESNADKSGERGIAIGAKSSK